MSKQLLFMLKDNSTMINAKFNKCNEKIFFNHLSDDERNFDITEIDRIIENHIELYVEDMEMLEFLIKKIKNDNTLIPRIKNQTSDKLLFLYEYEEE